MRSLHEVYILIALSVKEGFPSDSVVRNSSAMQEMWVRSLGWEDPLKEDMATHFSILAWRVPQTGKPGGLQPMGSQRT